MALAVASAGGTSVDLADVDIAELPDLGSGFTESPHGVTSSSASPPPGNPRFARFRARVAPVRRLLAEVVPDLPAPSGQRSLRADETGDLDHGIWTGDAVQGLIQDIPACGARVSRIIMSGTAEIECGRLELCWSLRPPGLDPRCDGARG